MDLDSTPSRDGRLRQAAELLRKPEKRPPPMWPALVASAGLAGTAVLLAMTMVFQPELSSPKPQAVQQVQVQTSSAAPGFELSSSSIAAPPSPGVVAGSEGGR